MSEFLIGDKANITANSMACKSCKDSCCCSYVNAIDYLILCLPEDFGRNEMEVSQNLANALISKKFRLVDYYGDKLVTTAVKDKIVDGKIQCIFLGPSGCELPSHKRPASCRLTKANKSEKCPTKLDLHYAINTWRKYFSGSLIM